MKYALLIESAPEPKTGRVHLTAFWMQHDRLRGQCFFTNPEKHFQDHDVKYFTDENAAKTWVQEK